MSHNETDPSYDDMPELIEDNDVPVRDIVFDTQLRNIGVNNIIPMMNVMSDQMLCDGIAHNIIANYNIIGLYYCGYCDNEIYGRDNAGRRTSATDDVHRHVQLHYVIEGEYFANGQIADNYQCNRCGIRVRSLIELEDHIIERHQQQVSDDESENDSDREYLYHCPICNRGFNDQIDLNYHFMRRHRNHSDLNMLDQKRADGFPGYELLQKIGMIRFVRCDEKCDSSCVICTETYVFSRALCDLDMYMYKLQKKKCNKFRQFKCDIKSMYYTNNINKSRKAVQLRCCNATMCSICIREHLNSKNGIPECPFCRKDHTQINKRFIIYDERPKHKIEKNPDPYPLCKTNIIRSNTEIDDTSLPSIESFGRLSGITFTHLNIVNPISHNVPPIEDFGRHTFDQPYISIINILLNGILNNHM